MITYVKSSHGLGWLEHHGEVGGTPTLKGPIELYSPVDDGTEELPEDANFEVEFQGEYSTLDEAIDNCVHLGRYMISRPGEGDYIGYLNSIQGSVGLKIY